MKQTKDYIDLLKNGTKVMFKEFFNKNTNTKQRANMLTFSRLLIAPIIPILIALGLPICAVTAIFIGAITDFFDGKCARKYNSTSEYGKILDPIVDKIFSIMIGISLSIVNPIFLINLIPEFGISLINILYQSKYENIKIKSSILGKIKQWPLAITFILGFVSILAPEVTNITNIFIGLTALLQTATFTNYIVTNENQVKRINQIKNNEFKDQIKVDDENGFENKKTLDNTKSRKEQYLNLKNLLSEVINEKNCNEQSIEEKGFQKTKNDFN